MEDFLLPTTEEVERDPGGSQYYDELFEEIEAELYPGCDWISSLNFLAKLLHLKVRGKMPNNIFDELLKLLKLAFPKENKIPGSCYEAKKRLKKFVRMAIVGIQRLKKKMDMIVLVNMKWIIQVAYIIVREQSYIRSRVVNFIFTGL